MDVMLWGCAGMAAFGILLTLRFLPARGAVGQPAPQDAESHDEFVASGS
jgi:hypothetical protein